MFSNSKRSRLRALILATLRVHGPMTRAGVAEILGMKPQSLCAPFWVLQSRNHVHIVGYRQRRGRGCPPAIYAAGAGKNTPRPKANRKASDKRYYERVVRERNGVINRRATYPDGTVRQVNPWAQILWGPRRPLEGN